MSKRPPSNISGSLRITIIDAKNLDDVESFGKQDPYCNVKMDDDVWFETAVKEDAGTKATWNFTGPVFELDGSQRVVDIQVLDKNTMSDELIGWVQIPIADIVAATSPTWFAIKRSGKPRGDLRLQAEYVDPNAAAAAPAADDATATTATEVGGSGAVWEQDATVTVRAANGNYFTALKAGGVVCNKDLAESYEKFKVVVCGGGKVGLLNPHGQYVSADKDGSVSQNVVLGDREQFTVQQSSDGRFALLCSDGNYVGVDGDAVNHATDSITVDGHLFTVDRV